MNKRLHMKHSTNVPFRHYLFHFKWPLFGLFIVVVLFSFNLIRLDNVDETTLDFSSADVIYPINPFQNKVFNRTIEYYFDRKDQMKKLDDDKSIERKQKVIIPFFPRKTPSKSYLILEFTHVFFRPRFCSHRKEDIFGRTCPFTNCEYTCDLQREKQADVLLMHKRDLNVEQMKNLSRNSEQIWLLWHDESNENSPEINQYKFNWTITYRLSAEASLGAYGITIVKDEPWPMKKFNIWIDQQFQQRANQAVWFVSNCRPKARLKKFHSLRKVYPIVAFGKCISPNDTYSLNARILSTEKCGRQSSCESLYLSSSKFYLAFESQTCTDYVTEKFWRTLSVGAIPIVSGPERKDFARLAPPHSFVHVNDYSSDEELARALNDIATNRTLFRQYHQWRQYYDVLYQSKDVDPYRFCELCYRLNSNQQRIWYENINEWFLEKC